MFGNAEANREAKACKSLAPVTVIIKSSNHTCFIGSVMHNNNVLMSFDYTVLPVH